MLFKNISTVDENWNVLKNRYVLVEGAFIRSIGDKEPEGYEGPVTDGKNKLLLPGFYNTHCHVPMTLLRGYGGGLPLQRWLNEKIFPAEAKLTAEDICRGTALGALELIAGGTVSISDMYFRIAEYAQVLDNAGMKANLTNGLTSFDPSERCRDNNACREIQELLAWCGDNNGRIRADYGIHGEYTSHEAIVREAAEKAKELGLIVQVHLSETKEEQEACKKRHGGMTPAQYFKACGLFENPVVAAHCVWLEDGDIEILRTAGASPVHCISSNMKLGSGITSIRRWMDGGLALTIGTDGASSNNNLNYLEEMHLAALAAGGITRDANAVSPADIFKAASRNGALAQGRKDCGLMKEGMRADLVMFDLDRPHLVPDTDTLANILYSAQSTDICMTMIDGKIVYKDGEFLTLDKEKVLYEAAQSAARLLA